MTRTLTTKKGKTIETTLTDREAMAILTAMETPSNFASKLREIQNPSHDQIVWIHVMACETFQPQPQEATEKFERIINRMTLARDRGLTWPKVRLQTTDGRRLVLSLTGAGSKRPGTINLTNGEPYGENEWYGRIETNGELRKGRDMNEDVLELLRKFEANPAQAGAIQGALTGHCAFCGRFLETRESVGAGYGPVCAERYGLAWGEVTAKNYLAVRSHALL